MFATKYIEFQDGTVIMFSNHLIHKDMSFAYIEDSFPASAGFVHAKPDGLRVYGESISLRLQHNPKLDLNQLTFFGSTLPNGWDFVLSTNPKVLERLGATPQPAPFTEVDDGYGGKFQLPVAPSFDQGIIRSMLP